MTNEGPDMDALQSENRYLKDRNAELQTHPASLSSEAQRLRERLERLHGRVALRRPDPLSCGQ